MTDSDNSEGSRAVLKCDARGRVRSSAAQRQALLEQFERSGLSGPAFARVAGINYQTFATWRQLRRRQAAVFNRELTSVGQAAACKPVRLVEAVVGRAGSLTAGNPALRVDLPFGASLTLTNSMQVALAAQLIQALRTPC